MPSEKCGIYRRNFMIAWQNKACDNQLLQHDTSPNHYFDFSLVKWYECELILSYNSFTLILVLLHKGHHHDVYQYSYHLSQHKETHSESYLLSRSAVSRSRFQTNDCVNIKLSQLGWEKLLTQNMQFWFVATEAVIYTIIPYITGKCKLLCLWQNGIHFSTNFKILIISQKWSVDTVFTVGWNQTKLPFQLNHPHESENVHTTWSVLVVCNPWPRSKKWLNYFGYTCRLPSRYCIARSSTVIKLFDK